VHVADQELSRPPAGVAHHHVRFASHGSSARIAEWPKLVFFVFGFVFGKTSPSYCVFITG
jgi:hypothetical protein